MPESPDAPLTPKLEYHAGAGVGAANGNGSARPGRRDRWATATRRWARDTFSRQSLVNSLKSLAWVAPLTVLIWIYAEREQLARAPRVPIPIEVRSESADRVVTLIVPASGEVTADLSGPRAGVDAIRETLGSRGGGRVVIEIPAYLERGEHPIDATLIGNDPRFVQGGVSIADCNPPQLTVFVDPIVEREVPVRAAPGAVNLADDPGPVFSPATVTVRGPESVIEAAERGGDLYANAQLAGLKELQIPGEHVVPGVHVTFLEGERHVTVEPGTVQASFTVERDDVELKISSMAIFHTAPPTLADEYKVVLETPTLTNVTLIGPGDQIERLRRGDPALETPVATFKITEDVATDEDVVLPVRFEGLPEGVRVSEADLRRTVKFRLVPRSKSRG